MNEIGEDLFGTEKRLFLLDGMALAYRAHFALARSPRFTSGGQCTSAVFGLTNAIFDLLNREKPTHLALAFDTPEPTQRHIDFPEYKAQRDAMPEDLASQFPFIDRLLEAFNIPVIRTPGYEADDIIGTLAGQAAEKGYRTWMVTPDKDYEQLVTEDIYIYKPGRKGSEPEVVGIANVLQRWGIERVEQVIDILGLMGDASDNIPGVKGIGPKTAQQLIAKFGSIEELLNNTDQLKGKQKERVVEQADMARLSRKLVTIIRDVPHDLSFEDFAVKPFDQGKLKNLMMELEFDTLGKRLFGKTFSSAKVRAEVQREKREAEIQTLLFDEPVEQKNIQNVEHNYHLVESPEGIEKLIEKLEGVSSFCFDTETTGIDPRKARPLGIAFSITPHEAYYVPFGEDPRETQGLLHRFQPLFENTSIEKVGHNLKYDISLLRWWDIDVHGPVFDTMLAHSQKEPEMKHGLDYLAKLYLGYTPIPISDLIGPKGDSQRELTEVPIEQVVEYACEDADVTLQIAAALRPEIEDGGVKKVVYEVECPLVPVLVEMEYHGIRLDTEALSRFSTRLEQEISELRERIHAAAGHDFNIDSPKQLGVVLFEELEIDPKPKKTSTGQYSTRESEMQRLLGRHEIVGDVLEYRNARKLKSVYVDQLPNAVDEQTGRVHTHYSQSWTATGRMQSNDPNLQTIPVRKERGRDIRAAFVPRDDQHLLLSADYSQIELRVMAELSGDKAMLEAFQKEIDIHTSTASKVYHVPVEEVTREMRDKAKTVNFGIIYGISAFGLQQRLNIPRAEASELIESYFEKYPGVQNYIDATIEFARENGFVVTKTGRRRYLRDINSNNRGIAQAAERLAMNSPIQGTAADILKLAMINVDRALRAGSFETKMILTVHDEIVFDLVKDEQADVMPVIEAAMVNTLPMKVPVVVEMGVGNNWLEAH